MSVAGLRDLSFVVDDPVGGASVDGLRAVRRLPRGEPGLRRVAPAVLASRASGPGWLGGGMLGASGRRPRRLAGPQVRRPVLTWHYALACPLWRD